MCIRRGSVGLAFRGFWGRLEPLGQEPGDIVNIVVVILLHMSVG